MQDAVILANCLYDLKSNSVKDITAAFQSFYDQRFYKAKELYDHSNLTEKIFSGQVNNYVIFLVAISPMYRSCILGLIPVHLLYGYENPHLEMA